MSRKLLRRAEEIRRIQEETSVDALRRCLPMVDTDLLDIVFLRINELLGEQDPGLLLSIALCCWCRGADEEANVYLEKAKRISHEDDEVLRTEIFFAVSIQDHDSLRLIERYLELHPRDEWALQMQCDVKTRSVKRLSMPPLTNEWQRLIRGET